MSGDVLDTPCTISGEDFRSIREFFIECMAELWREDEGFSGKRPLGNSGWKWDIYQALQDHGFISDIDNLDECRKADNMISEAIKGLR